MSQGIYLLTDDKQIDHARALANSIRFYDPDVPIVMIPYTSNYNTVADVLAKSNGVKVYQDLKFLALLEKKLHNIFSDRVLRYRKVKFRHNLLLKLACWFGVFDEFLYIDNDIVVFEKIVNILRYLSAYDFLCCDYAHVDTAKFFFKPSIFDSKVLSENGAKDVFNSGFWASKKNIFPEAKLYEILEECANHPEYFDPITVDQPIINYIVLKYLRRRLNIVRMAGIKEPGNWAGKPHFRRQGNLLADPDVNNQPLRYLHWAGFSIEPGCPYYDIWKYYHELK